MHVDFNVADIDQIYFPQVEVIGDIADSMTRLASELGGKLTHEFDLLPDDTGADPRACRRGR